MVKISSDDSFSDDGNLSESYQKASLVLADSCILEEEKEEMLELDDFENLKWISSGKHNFTFKYESSVSAFDVAAYILNKLDSMSTMKLQKLVYYCQVWSLVWDEKPLFRESIEAWANGPVVRSLFNYHRGMFTIESVLIGNPDLLKDYQIETIDSVLEFYGDKTAQWLIDLSHMEPPWQITRSGIEENARSNRTIDLEIIAEYYTSLLPE